MDRQAFYFLYANLNSIAELAFKQAAAQLLEQLPEESPPEDLTQEELDARVMAGFEGLDLSALDGLGEGEPADLESLSLEPPPAESEGPFNLETYLERAYSYEELLRERIDQHYRSADLPAFNELLTQLPGTLRPLTGRLSAAEMSAWLKLYQDNHEALTSLTVRMRQLDLP